MNLLIGQMLAWVPFVYPIKLPAGARLWTFLPLALCVAVVYRATRAKRPDELIRRTPLTFLSIVGGMWAIALAAYGVHQLVLRSWNPS